MSSTISALRREALLSPTLLSQFRADAEKKLKASPNDPKQLWRLGQLCRALSDFNAAARFYEAYSCVCPSDPLGVAMAQLMRGTLCGASDLGGVSPFLRIENFLSDADHAEMWALIAACAPNFRPSRIYRRKPEADAVPNNENESIVDAAHRVSVATEADANLRTFLLPKIKATITALKVLDIFELPDLSDIQVEMQVTAHLQKGFLGVHRDSGAEAPGRTLTFVYYVSRLPSRYSGGDLLLHDEDNGETTGNFTRISPTNNSLILFPSDRLHEVMLVNCDSYDPLDGRITINGWFHNL